MGGLGGSRSVRSLFQENLRNREVSAQFWWFWRNELQAPDKPAMPTLWEEVHFDQIRHELEHDFRALRGGALFQTRLDVMAARVDDSLE